MEINVRACSIEKIPPHRVPPRRELVRQRRVASRFSRGLIQLHTRLLRRAAPFADVALQAGAHNVFPARRPPLAARNDMIQAEVIHAELLAAVLAAILVPQKNVPAIELVGQ